MSDYYGQHVVAFVDILGFADLVQRMDENPSLIDSVYEVLSRVHQEDISEGFGDWIREGLANLTIASDSIFLSIGIDAWSRGGTQRDLAWACLAMLESIFWLQRYLLKRGVLTRGGVALGPLLHQENVIFGPALVRAYRLESQLALFPRVIVDTPVLKQVAAAAPDTHFKFSSRLDFLTTRDVDGLMYVDYLHFNAMSVENEPQIATLFGEVRNNIAVALEAARSDVRVLQKVAWLANYFNASLRRLVSEDIGGLQNVRSIEVARP